MGSSGCWSIDGFQWVLDRQDAPALMEAALTAATTRMHPIEDVDWGLRKREPEIHKKNARTERAAGLNLSSTSPTTVLVGASLREVERVRAGKPQCVETPRNAPRTQNKTPQ